MSEQLLNETDVRDATVEDTAPTPLDLSDDVTPATEPTADAHAETSADAERPPLPPLEKANILVRLWRGTLSVIDWLFGAAALTIALAVLATIPVLNFLSLGYLLAVSGRVATTGRLRDGFIGVRKAAVLGRVVGCSWVLLLPVRFVNSMWEDAWLIDPTSGATRGWRVALVVLTTLTLWHIAWAIVRGGHVKHFLWPAPIRFLRWVREPNKYPAMRDGVWDFVTGLNLPRYFWLGARGFVGTVIWLIVPVAVLVAASQLPPDGGGGLLAFLGGILLATAVLYIPFMQTHFAMQDRFGAMFETREVRYMFGRAPIAWWVALLVMLLFALPLYLLKIELTPAEVAWLPSLVFVTFIFPARILTGWAVSRSFKRDKPSHFLFRWTSRLAAVPVVVAYVFIVYLTQYLSWYGTYSILEQHAFLVPAPMLGM